MRNGQLENQIEYYRKRVPFYDKLYTRPERQEQLRLFSEKISELAKSKNILELGCGTGYWTACMEQTANRILATDFNADMIAMAKKVCSENVEFAELDYFKASDFVKSFDLIFGGFILSHIPLNSIKQWWGSMHDPSKKTKFVFCDNTYVEGDSTAIAEIDSFGNEYQKRIINDADEYLVMKNFFTEERLKKYLPENAENITYFETSHYWLFTFEL